MIQVKRVYDPPTKGDGFRVLVDRLWPRGLTKEKARVDLWLKEVAPSNELRKWYAHDPAKWPEFQKRYVAELAAKEEQVARVREVVKAHATVTLLFSAKNVGHNNADALAAHLASERRA